MKNGYFVRNNEKVVYTTFYFILFYIFGNTP